jgi:PAB-dependent poly(A)-specific ribonuclease subunit 2
MYTTCVIASVTGQLQVVDIVNANAVTLIKQAQVYDNNFLTTLEMAPSGEALAFTTSLCQVHLWGSPTKIHFTEFSNETVFADHVVSNATMDWSAETYVVHL